MNWKIDFRIDGISWLFLGLMLVIYMYFILHGGGSGLPASVYIQAFGIALLTLFGLIALVSIPVLIICYAIKKIPDIDYAIWSAFGITIIGVITELF
jgi:hypothetical protein